MLSTGADPLLRGERTLWQIEAVLPDSIRAELGGRSPMLSHLLFCRDYRSAAEIEAFFRQEKVSHDPFLIPDMDRAVERIGEAVRRPETIAVYGDFDCDGITSAALLVEAFERLGLSPLSHIPDRADGHGLHLEALSRLRDRGVTLVVTADCGIGAVDEVRHARALGMDVVVTDHHEPRANGSLPECPTVAPTRHDSHYPFRSLCGAGVAYKVIQAVSASIPGAPNAEEFLDLVALGTVADVVPLRDENRSLVIEGLGRLRTSKRVGLLALFGAAGIQQGKIDPAVVGFYLAPRINAANRMASPQMAYDLITATEHVRADYLAAQLSEHNQQRQLLVDDISSRLIEELGSAAEVACAVRDGQRAPIIVETGDWPAGVSGLLAAKLVEAYGLPAFIGSEGEDEIVSVSARGTPAVNIDQMLEECEASVPGGLFLGHGGHSGAGGFRIGKEKLRLAFELLERVARQQVNVDDVGAILTVDYELPLFRLDLHAAQQIRTLAPYGHGFSEPLFLTRNVRLEGISTVKNEKHARLRFRQGTSLLDGMYFNVDQRFLGLEPGTTIDMVSHLQLNERNGLVKPEICLRDWRVSPN